MPSLFWDPLDICASTYLYLILGIMPDLHFPLHVCFKHLLEAAIYDCISQLLFVELVSVCQEELSHVNQIIGFLKWYIQPIYSPFSAWAKHSSNLHISTPIAVKIASWVSKYMEPCSCSWVFCVVRVVGESLLLLSCS